MRRIVSVLAVVSVAFLTAAALAGIAAAQGYSGAVVQPPPAVNPATASVAAQIMPVGAAPQEVGRLIVGTPGNDRLRGASGPDLILGLGGKDALYGALGDDALLGGAGDDYLSGGAGHDRLSGGTGSDLIFGDSGNDYLNSAGDVTADLVSGRDGDDLCIVGPEDLPSTSGCEALYVVYPPR